MSHMSQPEIPLSQQPTLPAGSPCLTGERVAFTGTLASMTHRQAQELVAEHGGAATTGVSRQTTMLVIGEEGWPLEPDGKMSQKLEQVAELEAAGVTVRLVKETDWLHLLGLGEHQQQLQRLCTPAMLSKALDVPVGMIRRWERLNLIRPVKKVFRLPYFDFQEANNVRRLSELLASGLSRAKIEAGLAKLQESLSGIDRPLAQLDILARDSRLVYRDEVGLVEPATGQRLFDFDPTDEDSSDEDAEHLLNEDEEDVTDTIPLFAADTRSDWQHEEWLMRAIRLLEDGEPAAAVQAFRICLMERPYEPEVSFRLGEALYRSGNIHGALERYYTAVEADHNYIEAWTQLGCIEEELGRLDDALDAFEIALKVHPDFPDAQRHKAEVLHKLGRTSEAIPLWEAYLKHESRGPWAEAARQRLEDARDRDLFEGDEDGRR